ncbi:MAG: HutD family protein [Bacteroidetes bacterium]|nr:HutD family protein [Bacteroidota bacterium]
MQLTSYAQQKISTWSGGTTTELFIYPEEAEYSERNFDFRISTATVEVEESNFTQLPGYKRILMILQGELFIEHKNQHNKILQQYQCDEFHGEWETKAKGKVVDFNLMMKVGWNGSLSIDTLSADANKSYLYNESKFIGLYLLEGSLIANDQLLNQKDFLLFENKTVGDKINITSNENCKFVLVKVSEIDA